MLHLEPGKISSLEDIRYCLQKAIELEHATIPPYLTAYFSLYGNTNRDIQGIILGVAIEEMLHMTLAANLLNAVGGTPVIYSKDFIVDYPSKLPLGIGQGGDKQPLLVPIERFSKYIVENVFMEIEEPEEPIDFPVPETLFMAVTKQETMPEFRFETIGQFYCALSKAIQYLGDSIFTGDQALQVNVHDHFFQETASIDPIITDVKSAVEAIELIVEQGEGTENSPLEFPSDGDSDYAHYYKFQEILEGRKLKKDLTTTHGYSFSGGKVFFNPDEVYPMIANLKMENLRKGTEEYKLMEKLNRAYSRMLKELQEGFSGKPESIGTAIGTMRTDFTTAAKAVASRRINPDAVVNLDLGSEPNYNLTPSYEYVDVTKEPEKTRFDRVVQILDESVGGADIGAHGAFWRNKTRDEFIQYSFAGLDIVKLNDGAGSILVKALKGEKPFGSDLSPPTPGANFRRMPAGRKPVSDANIEFIQKWIDDGCPEDSISLSQYWRKTNAPVASSRTDDIFFLDTEKGWAANSNGQIIYTPDGGNNWQIQFTDENVYFRCLGFANENVGWAGTLTANHRLYQTKNGGKNWQLIDNLLPEDAQSAICGISVVNERVVYASGTNYPDRPTGIVKTTNGGATWEAIDMNFWADILVDCYFTSETTGWVVGGKLQAQEETRSNVKPVVLYTEDGGQTWDNRVESIASEFPMGEWGWKIQFLDGKLGYIALENFDEGAILKTTDGGSSWIRIKINDPQKNANLEGVGFIDEQNGWVGGWGDRNFQSQASSGTSDGGVTWFDANEIGTAINRFRFFGNPVTIGYASGKTVYKYEPGTDQQARAALLTDGGDGQVRSLLKENIEDDSELESIMIPVMANSDDGSITLRIWDRFGQILNTIEDPEIQDNCVQLESKDDHGNKLTSGHYILRLSQNKVLESSILYLK